MNDETNLIISDPALHRFNSKAGAMIDEATGKFDNLREQGWTVIAMPDPTDIFLCDFCNAVMPTVDEDNVPVSIQCIGTGYAICGACTDGVIDEHGPIKLDNQVLCPCCTGSEYINQYLVELNARYKA